MLLGSSLLTFGQHENRQMKMKSDFTPEQQAVLQTKQMVLELDLTDAQQKQMLNLNEKWAKEKAQQKEAFQKLNKDEMSSADRFNHMNSMLDKKIEHQNEIKKILNADQYKTWKKDHDNRAYRSQQKMAYHDKKYRGGQK